jgi:hypothetical protein
MTISEPMRADPTPEVLWLDTARHDGEDAVRRRVGDSLAQIARSRPTLALATAQRWLAEGGRYTLPIVRRGLRPLIEQRNDTAMRLAGFAPEAAVRARDLRLADDLVAFGEELRFTFSVVSSETRPTPILVEYHITEPHRADSPVVARGRLACRSLWPLATVEFSHARILPTRNTRVWRAGPHTIEVFVNGRCDATASFVVTV